MLQLLLLDGYTASWQKYVCVLLLMYMSMYMHVVFVFIIALQL